VTRKASLTTSSDTPAAQATTPTQRARDLVRGGYDTHVHIAPDVVARRITDVELAQRCAEVGMAGFVLKSHYVPTAERASVAASTTDQVEILGAITLNRAVGGINPVAVEIAAREGARIVWLPTVDAANEAMGRRPPAPGANLPVWAQVQESLREAGIQVDPVEVLDPGGELLPETQAVLGVIASHDMVLATGHLGRDEIFAVVAAAIERGIRRVVVTHPEFPSQNLSVEDQCELADMGALLERCLTTPLTGKVDWDVWLGNIRAVGPQHSILSSDLGQVKNPPVEDGLAIMADRLLDAGFAEEDVHRMAVENTRLIAAGSVA
jgi:hypothetical protein